MSFETRLCPKLQPFFSAANRLNPTTLEICFGNSQVNGWTSMPSLPVNQIFWVRQASEAELGKIIPAIVASSDESTLLTEMTAMIAEFYPEPVSNFRFILETPDFVTLANMQGRRSDFLPLADFKNCSPKMFRDRCSAQICMWHGPDKLIPEFIQYCTDVGDVAVA